MSLLPTTIQVVKMFQFESQKYAVNLSIDLVIGQMAKREKDDVKDFGGILSLRHVASWKVH